MPSDCILGNFPVSTTLDAVEPSPLIRDTDFDIPVCDHTEPTEAIGIELKESHIRTKSNTALHQLLQVS